MPKVWRRSALESRLTELLRTFPPVSSALLAPDESLAHVCDSASFFPFWPFWPLVLAAASLYLWAGCSGTRAAAAASKNGDDAAADADADAAAAAKLRRRRRCSSPTVQHEEQEEYYKNRVDNEEEEESSRNESDPSGACDQDGRGNSASPGKRSHPKGTPAFSLFSRPPTAAAAPPNPEGAFTRTTFGIRTSFLLGRVLHGTSLASRRRPSKTEKEEIQLVGLPPHPAVIFVSRPLA